MTSAIAVLHLEDDPADARLIREQLRRSGLNAEISLARDRPAFEEAFFGRKFDVILSDFHVPGINGDEALQLVRATDLHIPFILVTGALGEDRSVELVRTGATDFVLKDRLARLGPAIERALSEQAVRRESERVQARLLQAQRLSKLAAEAARMGVWQLDLADGKLECSDEFLELIAVERSVWPGTAQAFLDMLHEEDVQSFRHLLSDEGGRPLIDIELRIRKPDGQERWMHLRGDRLSEGRGGRDTVFGVLMDITERKRLEEALRESVQRKDEFLATLAHELRNPLAPLYNGLVILRRMATASPETDRVHAILDRQIKHVIRLVDDLLDMSRITAGKIELKRVPVDLRTVIEHAVEMSRALIEQGQHRLDVALPAEPVVVHGDTVRLTQVVANLLNNAATYMSKQGRIWVSARARANQVTISVRDNGIGIPPPMLDRIFDLFTQVGNTDRPKGPGLGVGLAMVRKLVELHGGEVIATSAGVGKGSEFVVHLPAEAATTVEVPPSNVGSERPLSGRRVLVVDDNHDAADSLVQLLKMSGAEAFATYDGISALDAVRTQRPEVVLLDIGMPGMDGYAVARRIRENAEYENMILVALTGFGQEHDRQRARVAGFTHHLTKPAGWEALETLFASAVSPASDSPFRLESS
jgi:PAS domain S-box-containing protein